MQIELGMASAWIRAARLGVSPIACSILPPPATHRPDHDETGVDAHARFDAGFAAGLARCGERPHAGHDGKSREHGSFGIILVRRGIAEKGDHAIADVLIDVAAVASDAIDADAVGTRAARPGELRDRAALRAPSIPPRLQRAPSAAVVRRPRFGARARQAVVLPSPGTRPRCRRRMRRTFRRSARWVAPAHGRRGIPCRLCVPQDSQNR